MPCRYDPSPEELKQEKDEETKRIVAPYLKKLNNLTEMLCNACQIIENIGGVVYDTKLKGWWKQHKESDAKRQKEELKKSALAKLTLKEIEALELK